MCTNAQSIAGRHVQIVRRLGEMAENGEQVDQLVRATIRNCFTAMRTAGTDATEAVEIICGLLEAELAAPGAERAGCRNVLESAEMHAEYLLFTEQRSLH
ncbi:hypothetical protein [Herbaspirillum robiniae]|uniref:Uncharacterized protein n=1 Tax=Herbaspirillum robiniae TaxID=2014887 RepID=A0A2D0B5W3_9BURK|nr:hypothetical protein [Herbaspirillum robiniae]NUU01856.1 hypothetical protein [Herbaspirillum robiniae]OWY30050.1 hypothetical protein CEJ42_07875 [Herbaspirillum robiniae]